jgi:hypothetical protein
VSQPIKHPRRRTFSPVCLFVASLTMANAPFPSCRPKSYAFAIGSVLTYLKTSCTGGTLR